MTDKAKRIAEIEKRVSEATEGPYFSDGVNNSAQEGVITEAEIRTRSGFLIGMVCSYQKDADFLTNSRQDIPYLLEELRRKDRIIARLRGEVEFACKYLESSTGGMDFNDPEPQMFIGLKKALEYDGTQEAE